MQDRLELPELSMLIASSVQRLAMSKNISRCAPGGIASAVSMHLAACWRQIFELSMGPSSK